MKVLFTSIFFCLLPLIVIAQNQYDESDNINKRINSLVQAHPKFASTNKIATSKGGKTILQITVGKANSAFTPGIAIVAGTEGNHPAGTELALQMAEKLLRSTNDSIVRLLNECVFYIIPCLNPDAHNQYFSKLKYERYGNGTITDADRDGLTDEDPYEDLNNDNYISMVRIQEPTGQFIVSKDDSRLMVKSEKPDPANILYTLISEGIDNDQDGKYNEDGPEGIHINKNFSFDYQPFQSGTGEHAVSEPENIGLLDSLFDKWNVFMVFSFALENNLSEPVKFDKQKVSKRIITGPLESDAKVNEQVSALYNKVVNMKGAPALAPGAGSFSKWAYFHYGRFSYVTPGWWAPVLEVKQDTISKSDMPKKGPGSKSKAGGSAADNYELQYLKWADSLGITDFFIPWTKIDHPDFPGINAEVGGFKPFVLFNPPLQYLEESADLHLNFLKELIYQRGRLVFHHIKSEKLDGDVFRISGKVVNAGQLPTHTELGDKTRWVRRIRNRILLDEDQSLLIGTQKSFHNKLGPGESFDFQWLVSGKGKITLEVGSPMLGLTKLSLDLK